MSGLGNLDSTMVNRFVVDALLDIQIPEDQIKYEILAKLKNKIYGMGQVILQQNPELFFYLIRYYESSKSDSIRAHVVRKNLEKFQENRYVKNQ